MRQQRIIDTGVFVRSELRQRVLRHALLGSMACMYVNLRLSIKPNAFSILTAPFGEEGKVKSKPKMEIEDEGRRICILVSILGILALLWTQAVATI